MLAVAQHMSCGNSVNKHTTGHGLLTISILIYIHSHRTSALFRPYDKHAGKATGLEPFPRFKFPAIAIATRWYLPQAGQDSVKLLSSLLPGATATTIAEEADQL
jgi:hypothetical protein